VPGEFVGEGERYQKCQPKDARNDHETRQAGAVLHVHEEKDHEQHFYDSDGERHNGIGGAEVVRPVKKSSATKIPT
jgi:hypothetical protein